MILKIMPSTGQWPCNFMFRKYLPAVFERNILYRKPGRILTLRDTLPAVSFICLTIDIVVIFSQTLLLYSVNYDNVSLQALFYSISNIVCSTS